MPGRIVQRNEATASDAKQMKFVELEMIRECMQIAGDAAGFGAGCRIGYALPQPLRSKAMTR